MSLIPFYLQYLSEICEGTRPVPAGMELTQTDDLQKAVELQKQVEAMGIPAFVRICAEADGTKIPQEDYDSFDPGELAGAIAQLAAQSAPAENSVPEDAPAEPVTSEIRDIYEVFLDSVCLDDSLLFYLIDILKRGAGEEFETLSRAAARTILNMDDFLLWLGGKELRASEEEHACVCIMDACLSRLIGEGQREAAAALLSGDETTFRLIRSEAPELQHLPAATYEWYCENYLDRYYPVRFLMQQNGVVFPDAAGSM